MSDLNVTDGKWSANLGVFNDYLIKSPSKTIAAVRCEGDAYLFAQAKNMYEKLDNIRILIEWGHNPSDLYEELLKEVGDIKLVLNACKPPKGSV